MELFPAFLTLKQILIKIVLIILYYSFKNNIFLPGFLTRKAIPKEQYCLNRIGILISHFPMCTQFRKKETIDLQHLRTFFSLINTILRCKKFNYTSICINNKRFFHSLCLNRNILYPLSAL